MGPWRERLSSTSAGQARRSSSAHPADDANRVSGLSPFPPLARGEARARSSRESAGRKMRARARRELKIEKGKESWSGEERKHEVTVLIVTAFVEVLLRICLA